MRRLSRFPLPRATDVWRWTVTTAEALFFGLLILEVAFILDNLAHGIK